MNKKSINKYFAENKEKITPQELVQDIQDLTDRCMATVFKGYLPYIAEGYEVKSIQKGYAPSESVASFDITKLVLEKNDKVIEKLKNVYYLLANSNDSIALIINRKHNKCNISLAVGREEQNSESIKNLADNVRDALLGNFPGTDCSRVSHYSEDSQAFLPLNLSANFSDSNFNSVGIVSNIATDFSEDFATQGIEKLIDGIIPARDKEYTIYILGRSLTSQDLERRKNELYNLYTAMSPFAKQQRNWGTSEGKNWTSSFNASLFGNVGMKVIPGLTQKITSSDNNFAPGIGASLGGGKSWGGNVGISQGESVEVNQFNVTHTLEIIEKQMKRLEECEALGLWDFAAYIFSADFNLVSEVSHMYMSLTQGTESFMEKPAVNIWNAQSHGGARREEIRRIRDYITYLAHPIFWKNGKKTHKYFGSDFWPGYVFCTAGVSGAELARSLNLPRKSVPGFAVIECAPFGREITSYDPLRRGDIRIGNIHHMHHDEELEVTLNSNSLTSHVFVTGSTGSGKSNTVYTLLSRAKTNFLVIEPAKGEYRQKFGSSVHKFGTNNLTDQILHLNPFAFPKGVHVFEHIDRILDVFNVCWPMYAAMPAVLKDAVIHAYEKKGWDMETSLNDNGPVFPTFSDVYEQIGKVIDKSQYSDESKGNYKGSLETRLKSLTNGINGLIFCRDDIPNEILFDSQTIVDLSRVGSSENKALIMGILVIRLQEYRMCQNARKTDEELRHITVLEEAHNLLRNSSSSSSPELGGGLEVKSVEMLSNAIAEMRTYGEGFVIVDQAPGLLDKSVIRNTNTKIIMRLPDQEDRELVGRAANLNDDQIQELAKLQRGVAAVYQNEWIEPVLCHVDKYEYQSEEEDKKLDITRRNLKAPGEPLTEEELRYVNSCIFDPNYLPRRSEINFVDCIERMELPEIQKKALIHYAEGPFEKRKNSYGKIVYEYFHMKRFMESTSRDDMNHWDQKLVRYLGEHYLFDPVTDFSAVSNAGHVFREMILEQYILGLNTWDPEEYGRKSYERMEYFDEKYHKYIL